MQMGKIYKLKYQGYAIGLQEVPDEISLIFNVSGCPYHCDGCHSQYLWKNSGRYLKKDIYEILNGVYKDGITCVCFMGGDQCLDELSDILRYIKLRTHYKTCLYSGADNIGIFKDILRNNLLDYIKIGSYKKELGGLSSKSTNQVFYKVYRKNKNDIDVTLKDITYKFQNQYAERIS